MILYKNQYETWQAGHIVSEKNGGDTNVDNLKPSCQACNLAMGSQNGIDYISIED